MTLRAKLTRLPLIQEGVHRLRLDGVGFIDTFRWNEVYKPHDLCELFGFTYAANTPLEDERLQKLGHDNGVAFLTNLPVENSEVIRMYSRNALLTTIMVDTKPVDVVTMYLDDVSEETRLFQIRALLSQLRTSRPTILMGDFNTMNTYELRKSKNIIQSISDKHEGVTERLWPKLVSLQRGTVIPFLKAHEFIDAAEDPAPNVPTTLFGIGVEHPVFRLDYIVHTKEIHSTPTEVKTGTIFDYASDHYPIVSTVSMNKP